MGFIFAAMYKLIRSFFFLFDAEKVHYFAMNALRFLCSVRFIRKLLAASFQPTAKNLAVEKWGLEFKNPVGLAAGFDKNAKYLRELEVLGFGFVEIGTVTPKPQDGNDKPRLFRLPKDKAIINRMGFNNEGLEQIVKNLKKSPHKVIIGGNIGKNTDTLPENYTADYVECFRGLHDFVDYFVLNVSCPNVSSHAKLEDADYLKELIKEIQKVNAEYAHPKPVLLKIAPDLNKIQLDEIVELVAETKIDGIIATNTSVSRENLKTSKETLEKIGNGGLSGKPIREKSTEVIRYLAERSNKSFPIIGVGGIHSAEDALEKLEAGASLVQIYTGFIYEGPGLMNEINNKILESEV